MKHLLHLLLLIICSGAFGQAETPEKTLIKLEEKRLNAIINRDSVTLGSIYDNDYKGVLASGHKVNKAALMEFQLSTSSPHVKTTIEEVEALVYGNVGVTTGKQVNRSKSGNILGQSKFIRVYVKKGDTWKIVRSQGTLMLQE